MAYRQKVFLKIKKIFRPYFNLTDRLKKIFNYKKVNYKFILNFNFVIKWRASFN